MQMKTFFRLQKQVSILKQNFDVKINCYIQNQASISKMEHRLEI